MRLAAQAQRSIDKDYLTQCLPDFITRHFGKARERAGVYAHLPVAERPTFHEIRTLGSKLYHDAQQTPQLLLGHTSEKMTKHYLDGHGVQWTEVGAGLVSPKI